MPNGKPCTVLQLRQCCSTAAVFTIAPTTGGWRYNHFRQFLKTFLIKNIYLTKQEREIKKLSEKVKKKCQMKEIKEGHGIRANKKKVKNI